MLGVRCLLCWLLAFSLLLSKKDKIKRLLRLAFFIDFWLVDPLLPTMNNQYQILSNISLHSWLIQLIYKSIKTVNTFMLSNKSTKKPERQQPHLFAKHLCDCLPLGCTKQKHEKICAINRLPLALSKVLANTLEAKVHTSVIYTNEPGVYKLQRHSINDPYGKMSIQAVEYATHSIIIHHLLDGW